MQQTIGKTTFDNQGFGSILTHARKLEGQQLREIAKSMLRPELIELKGKGAAGQLLHSWFGLKDNDNRAEPDLMSVRFSDGRTGGVEIKAVPLMLKKRGLRIKERCKVTNIDYGQLLDETWSVSRARHKLISVMFIFYRYAGLENWPASQVEKIVYWEVETAQVGGTIRLDWQRTWDYVSEGRAHEISEGHGMILGACTTGQGGDSKHVIQPRNTLELARKRAFALKPAFLQTTYEYIISPASFKSISTLSGKTFSADLKAEVLLGFEPLIGKRLEEIANRLKISKQKTKHASALLVRRALGILNDKKRLLELEAAGVKPKTIPVRERDLRPCEAMSFPAMRLTEFVEEEWKDSEFRAHLDCLLLIPTLAVHCKQELWSRRLGRPFFWTPSGDDEAGIANEWEMFKQEIIEGKAAYKRVNGRRISKLTPGSMTKYIHLRPKSRDGTEDDVDPNGRRTQRLCFWLNQSFIQKLLHK
ncbi:MAG TPA: MutH/Sau3AI family endonuclease [Verrucomicrobiae bacterium]|jgi:DNA mismatch repair protein MutH